MAQVYPVAGSKIFIGSRVRNKGTVTPADFANVNWVEIGGWASAGALGDTQEVGEQSLINERRVTKFKTTNNGGEFENVFVPMPTDPGQIRFKQAIDDCSPYQFMVAWGADCVPSADVTVSVATPGVVTWVDHGLEAGQPITFSTTGTLPTGLAAETIYYVLAAGLTADTFTVSETEGGTAVAVTAEGTGIQTASAPPVGQTDMFLGLAMPGARSGGEAAAANLRTWTIAVTSNIVEV